MSINNDQQSGYSLQNSLQYVNTNTRKSFEQVISAHKNYYEITAITHNTLNKDDDDTTSESDLASDYTYENATNCNQNTSKQITPPPKPPLPRKRPLPPIHLISDEDIESDSISNAPACLPRSFSVNKRPELVLYCNAGHKLLLTNMSNISRYYCSLCGIENILFAYYCGECNYGICKDCFLQEQHNIKQSWIQPDKKKQKTDSHCICPWHISALIISIKNNSIWSIRDYDMDTELTLIWSTEFTDSSGKIIHKWINLNKNNQWNYIKNTPFIPDINWRAPKLELYQVVEVECDIPIYENKRFGGIVVAFDFRSRRHCVDYGHNDLREWRYMDDKIFNHYDTNATNVLENRINEYLNNKIPYKSEPPFTPELYGLNNKFIKRSQQIYVRRNYWEKSDMIEHKEQMNQVLVSHHPFYKYIESEELIGSDIDDTNDSDLYVQESDSKMDRDDDEDFDIINSVHSTHTKTKRKSNKSRKKKKKKHKKHKHKNKRKMKKIKKK
eukprot:112964_1